MLDLTPQQMDTNALKAKIELGELITSGKISKEAVIVLANWWFKWRDPAGHKRLGRILIEKIGK